MAEPSKTEQRKAEHVNIILQENVSAEYNYWTDVRLVHNALPEIDLDDIDLGVKFFGKRLEAPLIISSMTGGFGMGKEINANLAKAAGEVGVAMGVGSQRSKSKFPSRLWGASAPHGNSRFVPYSCACGVPYAARCHCASVGNDFPAQRA